MSGINFRKKETTQLKRPKPAAMSQCYQGRPPFDTWNAMERNSTIITCNPVMTTQRIRKRLFVKIPLKIFFSPLIFLQLTKLNIYRMTNMLKTLVM